MNTTKGKPGDTGDSADSLDRAVATRHLELVGSKREMRFRRDLPYGVWTCADGREVLYNRFYQPIWQRHDGVTAPIDLIWVHDIVKHKWFYGDGTRDTPALWNRLQRILDDFKAGLPLTSEH